MSAVQIVKGVLTKEGREPVPTAAPGVWQLISEDYRTNLRSLMRPGFHAMVTYRLGRWAAVHGRRRRPVLWLAQLMQLFVRNFYGIDLYWTTEIGRRLMIPHHGTIVIHRFGKIGNDCVIHQGVTLGAADVFIRHEGPVLGDNVDLGAGSMILGSVRIGSNVRIGPNCVVTSDVPDHSTVFPPASRLISWGAESESP